MATSNRGFKPFLGLELAKVRDSEELLFLVKIAVLRDWFGLEVGVSFHDALRFEGEEDSESGGLSSVEVDEGED